MKQSYTARKILDLYEEEPVVEMTPCDCQPVGETNVVECDCDREWEDYTLTLDEN
ncbi:acetyltransferase [Bacillus pseudomycoides]|nr:acetyltransferase [Bacillus pseudomycoides]PEI90259.1 acetyltransferase [Bacillus pseudomycoides]PEK10029.1 acetyltransferase [Bacillus pseudomycoides]PEM64170.1 acetyltransferase [Bacillus pseudomycoides]PEO09296.1 acetyltransferase [Bacillus pseudomycoides]